MNSLFALFRTGAWIRAALVLRRKNPVHSVFYLVLVFIHASGLLCLLGLEYFALLQLLVYVGALAVMFLFVVMLLDIPATEIVAQQRGTYPVAGILLICLLIAGLYALFQPRVDRPLNVPLLPWTSGRSNEFSWKNLAEAASPVAQLGVALYSIHVDLLIIASFVLLVAMVGAVALTLKRRAQAPVHDIFAQHNRDFEKVICTLKASLFIMV
jgi:NADH-quinone oxidoreductase subunit J